MSPLILLLLLPIILLSFRIILTVAGWLVWLLTLVALVVLVHLLMVWGMDLSTIHIGIRFIGG